jgi:serine/threonine protein kinase
MNLATIHSLQIIHFDIKPQNIMYSKSFKKTVLIDFGLSKMISEKVGKLTYVPSFRGTYIYSSNEMK